MLPMRKDARMTEFSPGLRVSYAYYDVVDSVQVTRWGTVYDVDDGRVWVQWDGGSLNLHEKFQLTPLTPLF